MKNLAALVILGFASSAWGAIPLQPTESEQKVTCRQKAWVFTESRLLRMWAWAADGHNDKKLATYVEDLQDQGVLQTLAIRSRDGRVLNGWRLANQASQHKVAVIVGLGNVATADLMVQRLQSVSEKVNVDFILMDYRGYARSRPGIASFEAFVQDQIELGERLRGRGYQTVIGYGTSLGGIVLANAVSRGLNLDRLILDSVPADLANFDCDAGIYPINVIGAACPRVAALTSDNDREVSPAEQRPLLDKIESCGGKVVHLHTAIHAFNDKPGSPGDSERLGALKDLLVVEAQL